MLPPLERSTYQIHIPWRSNGVLLRTGASSTCPAPPVSALAEGSWPIVAIAVKTTRSRGSRFRLTVECSTIG
jgi:hypothetical protein